MELCLGIESTAHTFGISVVDFEGNILSNIRDSFTTKSGGMIPAEVADHHAEKCGEITRRALKKAKCKLKDIDLIAFSRAPGLGHTLKIGQFVAKYLSRKFELPVIGVDHCIAHLEIGRLKGKKYSINKETKNFSIEESTPNDPILLYASGANTQIIAYESGKYRIFGETLDIGIGNFLDTFARALKLGFPGGPKIEKLASEGKNFIELPYSVKGMDLNLGGLLTNLKQKIKKKSFPKEDLCLSAQETAFSMLIEISERALAHTGKKELLLGGGVACNKRLQEMAIKMCEARGARCYILDNEFNVDNAAMIAWTGILMKKSMKNKKISNISINPYERTDEVDVFWREDNGKEI